MPERRFTPDAEAAQAERQALVAKLEAGFQRVQQSDEYCKYLDTVSRFHKYSASNTMLIWLQRPDATLVAGFHTWLSLGRHVRKGEKGIRIFAPIHQRRTMPVIDDETDEPDKQAVRQLRFRPVSVFDVSQTDGAELAPPPVSFLEGKDEIGLWTRLATLAQEENLTIDRTQGRGGGANGWYNRSAREIWVDPGLPPTMASKTLCHEIGHHYAEHIDTRQEHETIAESVAYIVLGRFGVEAGDYSFGYLAHWTDAETFKGKLRDIQAIARRVINNIEEQGESDSLEDAEPEGPRDDRTGSHEASPIARLLRQR